MKDNLDRDKPNYLTVRPALPSDSSQLLKWRNHELVRRFSKNSSLISEQDHESWIKSKLAPENSTNRIYIFQADDTAAGVTRIELIDESRGELSIIVEPSFFSRGYGSFMLQRTIEIGFGEVNLIELTAIICDSNFASIAIFTKCGFIKLKGADGFSTYSLSKK